MLATAAVWLVLTPAERIAAGARAQLAPAAQYDASYQRIAYPFGDVDWDKGACTDVVVRAFRAAGYDLQSLVYKDRREQGQPTDTNIDHRRVRNLAEFFKRHGKSLNSTDWRPGDVVYWKLDNGLDHTGIVSSRKTTSGNYLVVHNIAQTREEDVLNKWQIVGHYRYP